MKWFTSDLLCAAFQGAGGIGEDVDGVCGVAAELFDDHSGFLVLAASTSQQYAPHLSQ